MRLARIAGFFGLLALASCDLFVDTGEKCPDIAGAYFNTYDVSAENYRRTAPCCAEPVPAFGRLAFQDYSLQLNYLATYYSEHVRSGGFDLFPPAMALSCMSNGELGSSESLSEIQIITLYDIDANHKKGMAVNDLFDHEEMGARSSLNEYLSRPDKKLRHQNATLYLRDQPALCDTIAFKIEVLLDNGENYTCVSAPVIFE